MSHQVQQMNHYTKKLSHFEAWQMRTYKPVTTTITVIITFRKQKLCSTLKMVSFDLVFPCLFFLIYYRFLFFLIASSTIFWVLAMFCDCLLSSSSCSPNALDRSSIANLWAAWKNKRTMIEQLLDTVTEDKIWKLKGIMMSYYKSKIISIKNCSVE